MTKLLLVLMKLFAKLIFYALSRYQKIYRRLPEWYFFALEGVSLNSAVELIVIKKSAHGEEIFLIRRPENDPYWPNELHFPGTIVRFHDTFEIIFARLADELEIPKLPKEPELITVRLDTNPRGRHSHLFYKIEVAPNAEFASGKFYPVNDLPSDMIEYQKNQLKDVLNIN
ncbi:MAG: hypothetical protein Q8P30_02325 [Candidatus Uhrbacteria bacterium]|nr:hypothetical protein [Candidatus Uhrbacteria bacterium]